MQLQSHGVIYPVLLLWADAQIMMIPLTKFKNVDKPVMETVPKLADLFNCGHVAQGTVLL